MVFQDLAQSTLIAQRALRPVTKALSERNIRFRWNYPFALVVIHQKVITSPADVPAFQQALGLPTDTVEDRTHLAMERDKQRPQKGRNCSAPPKNDSDGPPQGQTYLRPQKAQRTDRHKELTISFNSVSSC
ncbi:Hypothetical predicted protein [Pelobates cultripes]|uniref:Uncharacterized protein n=1 Tax=Pelobates cultripes TaxID=61616 RepID=A0AAD1WUN3_PELCU|nr:Hypothetical predicted protein [Pelobates cultripes]